MLIILLIGFISNSFACDCYKLNWANWDEQAVVDNINQSELIFIGNLISSTTESYKFKVIEVFKGEIKKGDIIDGFYPTSCSGRPHPKRNKEWIFYGFYINFEGDYILNFSTCGLTRSLRYPVIYKPEEHIQQWHKELAILNKMSKKNIKFDFKIQ